MDPYLAHIYSEATLRGYNFNKDKIEWEFDPTELYVTTGQLKYEATHLREKESFVDEKRVGPYALWHHQHFIETIENGILMKDIVSYGRPLGIAGAIANGLCIRHKLKEIFDYRQTALERRFGVWVG